MQRSRSNGFSLLELMTVVGIIGATVALASPGIGRWIDNQNLKSAVRDTAGLVSYARSQAVRTGNVYIVFFQTDAQNNGLADVNGNPVPVLVLNDGLPGSANQNCKIDAGEETYAIQSADAQGVSWGQTGTNTKVGSDDGDGDQADGWSFEDPNDQPANWLLFRGQGTPFSFAPNCTVGAVGSGAGGVYVTNGRRDHAIVITPLGAVRVHTWQSSSSAWSS